jgi:hypothetical protein
MARGERLVTGTEESTRRAWGVSPRVLDLSRFVFVHKAPASLRWRLACVCCAFALVATCGAPLRAQDEHPASQALAGLDVRPGLEATLFASEPMMLSPTNIDVDHRGRVWVCEVVNYRHRNGERPEGDRILILEDTHLCLHRHRRRRQGRQERDPVQQDRSCPARSYGAQIRVRS